MTKRTINELAYAKGTSELVRVAMLAMQEKLNAPWVSLTDDEIKQIALDTPISGTNFARAIEEKLKEKNHDTPT